MDRREREEGFVGCTLTKTLLVEHPDKREKMKYGRYPTLLDTWVGWRVVAVLLEEQCTQNLLIPKTVGPFLITEKGRPPQIWYDDVDYRRRTNAVYFVILKRSEECAIRIAHGSLN